MKPFSYTRPATREEAQALLTASARPKGGGMDLLDLAKSGVSTPQTMVDVTRVPDIGKSWTGDHGETYLGAGMTLAAVADKSGTASHRFFGLMYAKGFISPSPSRRGPRGRGPG